MCLALEALYFLLHHVVWLEIKNIYDLHTPLAKDLLHFLPQQLLQIFLITGTRKSTWKARGGKEISAGLKQNFISSTLKQISKYD